MKIYAYVPANIAHLRQAKVSVVRVSLNITQGKNHCRMSKETIDKKDAYKLHVAASEGDLQRTERLIEEGFDVNEINADGQMPLHLAARNRSTAVMELLIRCGARLERFDARRKSPTVTAKSLGYAELVTLMEALQKEYNTLRMRLWEYVRAGDWIKVDHTLKPKCLINIRLPGERTLLHEAMHRGMLEAVDKLLDRGINIQAQDIDKKTALHVAVLLNSHSSVDSVASRGAGVQAKVGFGESALNIAGRLKDYEAVDRLLDHGTHIQAQDRDGKTALHLALRQNSLEIVQKLLDCGANKEAVDNQGQNALYDGIRSGSFASICAFFEGDKSIQVLNDNGSIRMNLSEVIKALFQSVVGSFANKSGKHSTSIRHLFVGISRANGHGKPAEMQSLEEAHIGRVICKLIDNGALIDGQDENGRTALHIAAYSGSPSITRTLLSRGANSDAKDKHGRTALHSAAKSHSSATIATLVEFGVEVSTRDDFGMTALHVTAQYISPLEHLLSFNEDVREYAASIFALSRNGRDIETEDKLGRTALYIACQSNSLKVFTVLVEQGADMQSIIQDETMVLSAEPPPPYVMTKNIQHVSLPHTVAQSQSAWLAKLMDKFNAVLTMISLKDWRTKLPEDTKRLKWTCVSEKSLLLMAKKAY